MEGGLFRGAYCGGRSKGRRYGRNVKGKGGAEKREGLKTLPYTGYQVSFSSPTSCVGRTLALTVT
jgi:hypothetical protein